jgi:hypothetical protein
MRNVYVTLEGRTDKLQGKEVISATHLLLECDGCVHGAGAADWLKKRIKNQD